VSESARALAGDNASLVVGNFGGNSFAPGERRQVSITMANNGSTTWTTGGSYMLHWVNGTFFGWGDTLVTTPVAPTGQNQFVFTLVAPTTPGTYTFKAQMISYTAGGGAWFGQQVSTQVTVASTVLAQLGSTLVSQNFPTVVSPGQSITATVVMQNTGSLTWPAGKQFLLYNRNNPVNAWGTVWVATATTVGPGGMATYTLKLKAPATVPNAFLWQMYDSSVGFFGQLVNVPITRPKRLLVASSSSNQVLAYDAATGAFLGVFASGGGLSGPYGLAFGPDGNLYVSSFNTNQILRYNGATGAFIDVFTNVSQPNGIAFATPTGGGPAHLFVCGQNPSWVFDFDGTTGAQVWNSSYLPGFQTPIGVTQDPFDGLVHVVALGSAVYRINTADTFVAPSPFASWSANNGGHDIAIGPDQNLYLTDFNAGTVLRFNGSTGASMGAFVPSGSGGLGDPNGLVFGPDGNLYVASLNGSQVLRYSGTTGAFIDVFVASGSGGLASPGDLVFTP
jgi:outer membrane protein assembly factor BamB